MEGKVEDKLNRQYVAGLLDGEGYFGIMLGTSQIRRKFVPTVKMAMTHEEIVRLVQKTFGGHIHIRPESRDQNYKISWKWEARSCVGVKRVLDYVQPFLIVKKVQAKVLREFIETVQPNAGSPWKLDPAILEKRAQLYHLMKKLNFRGLPPAETKRNRTDEIGEAIVRATEQSVETSGNVLSAVA